MLPRSTIQIRPDVILLVKESVAAAGLLFVMALFCGAQMVEVPTDPQLKLQICRSTHRVMLYCGNHAIKTYSVAVGRAGWETPLGSFKVFQMLRDPIWIHPLTGETFAADDPGNELGHYWIGFAKVGDNCVGFHGTPHPRTVGQSLSHGCIRMYERDIEELFLQVSIGTMVTVVP